MLRSRRHRRCLRNIERLERELYPWLSTARPTAVWEVARKWNAAASAPARAYSTGVSDGELSERRAGGHG